MTSTVHSPKGLRISDEVHTALRVRAAQTGETMGEIAERALRRELGMMAITWQVIEDNGGGLHLAVFEGDGVIYYASGYERMPGDLQQDLEALREGSHPVRDTWHVQDWIVDGDHDLQRLYDALTHGEHGWKVVADEDGVYRDRMGRAAEEAFKTTAEKVAELLGDDGQRWEAEDGRTLEQVAEDHGAYTETKLDGQTLTRYGFDDGSAIIAAENGWDIEGAEPWSWQGEE